MLTIAVHHPQQAAGIRLGCTGLTHVEQITSVRRPRKDVHNYVALQEQARLTSVGVSHSDLMHLPGVGGIDQALPIRRNRGSRNVHCRRLSNKPVFSCASVYQPQPPVRGIVFAE